MSRRQEKIQRIPRWIPLQDANLTNLYLLKSIQNSFLSMYSFRYLLTDLIKATFFGQPCLLLLEWLYLLHQISDVAIFIFSCGTVFKNPPVQAALLGNFSEAEVTVGVEEECWCAEHICMPLKHTISTSHWSLFHNPLFNQPFILFFSQPKQSTIHKVRSL